MKDLDYERYIPRGTLLHKYLLDKFIHKHGYTPDLSAPTTFNEKILHRMLFDRRKILTTFADKIAVRDYVRQRLGSTRHLSTICRIFDKPDDLYSFKFPQRFVLKANHGYACNYIHARPTDVDVVRLVCLSRRWLKKNFAYTDGEWAYKDIEPRLFCEEYLGTDRASPIDYMFFCFAGKVHFIQADFDRHDAHTRNIYDCGWNLLDVRYRVPNKPDAVSRPKTLSEMKSIAEQLSAGMDFVRVDLYDLEDRIVFGELTNYPAAGGGRFYPAKWDLTFGSYWHLESQAPTAAAVT